MPDQLTTTELDEAIDTADAVMEDLEDDLAASVDRAAAAASLDEARSLLLDRLEDAREVLAARARTDGTRVASWARTQGGELADRAVPVLTDRAERAREDLTRRWQELEQDLPVDAETVTPYLERGAWQLFRAVLGVLLVLPRLIVRGLGQLSVAADDVSDRGLIASERVREAAGSVPASTRDRRRRRMRTAAWTGAGFGLGLGLGWLLGRQEREPAITYEPADLAAHLEPATAGIPTHELVVDPDEDVDPEGDQPVDDDGAADR